MKKERHDSIGGGQRSMVDVDIEEALIAKVGGKFALTILLQRRMIELNRGAPPLVKVDGNDKNLRQIVCQEILQGKIILGDREVMEKEMEGEKQRIESAGQVAAPPKEDDGEVYGSDIKKIKEQRIKELTQLLNPTKKP
jgi:DNA-directed RNA polymerase subunit omega